MTNSKIGKTYASDAVLKSFPDSMILVEAAIRRGVPLSQLIKPTSRSEAKTNLTLWRNAKLAATNPDFPNMNPLYDIYDNILIDLVLSANLDTRILRLQQAKFQLVDDKGKNDPEAVKLLQKQWFLDLQKFAMESIYEHYRLIEMMEFDEAGELIKIKAVNKYHVKSKLGFVVVDPSDDTGFKYLEPPYAAYYMPIGDPESLGLLYKIAPFIFAIKSAVGQWGEFNEKLGIPFRSVTSNAADSKRQQQLAIIMEEMGSAGWAVLNEGEKVELTALAGTNPTDCFEKLINLLDSRIATYLMGQGSTTSSDKNKGTYGSLQILQEVTEDRHQSDLTFFEYLCNDILLKRLPILSPVYKVFEKLRFEWDKSIDLTVSEVVDYVVKLSDVYDIDPEYVTQKTGIPIRGVKSSGTTTPPDLKKKSKAGNMSLQAFYDIECCPGHEPITAVKIPSFTDHVLRVAKLIFDGKQKGVLDEQLFITTADFLVKGILSGFKPITEDSDLLDKAMIKSLKENVFVFSGFKTYDMLRVMTDLITDDKNVVRTWAEYKKEVLKVDNTYNIRYLQAEYDNAVVSASQASYWNDIQANKAALPYLRFVATLDDRTTSTCRALDGVVRRVDDEFWSTYFLPLHWRERSLIQQLADGTETDMSTIKLPALQKMFENNVGITGAAFPESHPYYDVSKTEKNKVNKEVKKLMPDQ